MLHTYSYNTYNSLLTVQFFCCEYYQISLLNITNCKQQKHRCGSLARTERKKQFITGLEGEHASQCVKEVTPINTLEDLRANLY